MGAKLSGGSGGGRNSHDVNAEPNVIPFIDVMLVLLIIFMVTAPIAAVDIKADMPASEVIASKRPNKPVWVTLIDGPDCVNSVTGRPVEVKGVPVTVCPSYFVMEEAVDQSQIGRKVIDALKVANPRIANDDGELRKVSVYVRASGTTQYKNVMRVMNRLQDEGLYKVSLVASDKTP
jgi:biopolymer transport protein ExbD